MLSNFRHFERIVRRANQFTEAAATDGSHPFDARNIHPDLLPKCRKLFDDGHYPQATFEAFKFVDEEMQRISGSSDFGKDLMMKVLGGTPPLVNASGEILDTNKTPTRLAARFDD